MVHIHTYGVRWADLLWVFSWHAHAHSLYECPYITSQHQQPPPLPHRSTRETEASCLACSTAAATSTAAQRSHSTLTTGPGLDTEDRRRALDTTDTNTPVIRHNWSLPPGGTTRLVDIASAGSRVDGMSRHFPRRKHIHTHAHSTGARALVPSTHPQHSTPLCCAQHCPSNHHVVTCSI